MSSLSLSLLESKVAELLQAYSRIQHKNLQLEQQVNTLLKVQQQLIEKNRAATHQIKEIIHQIREEMHE
jgi:uncharacterized protein (TIGR02449 family)